MLRTFHIARIASNVVALRLRGHNLPQLQHHMRQSAQGAERRLSEHEANTVIPNQPTHLIYQGVNPVAPLLLNRAVANLRFGLPSSNASS
jgi:hypothetical protein